MICYVIMYFVYTVLLKSNHPLGFCSPFYFFYKWNHGQYILAFLTRDLQELFDVEVKTDFTKVMSITFKYIMENK